MKPKNDASLKGKLKNYANAHGLRTQEVLQMYLFERFLARLEKSEYSDKVILKGGLLISNLIGLAQRTTMDMDTTIKGLSMDEETIIRMVKEVCAIPVDDDMEFAFERIEPIREDDVYANFRAHIKVKYGKIDAPMKLDITTGDAIVPKEAEYKYRSIFDDEEFSVMAYPLATIIAEKYETVVRRGIGNTRARDFYDLSAILKVYAEDVDWAVLREAVESTAKKRDSLPLLGSYKAILGEVKEEPQLLRLWDAYCEENSYAKGLPFNAAVDIVISLGDKLEL